MCVYIYIYIYTYRRCSWGTAWSPTASPAASESSKPSGGIRIWTFLGEAHKWNIIEYPRIFNDIPFIGSRIFHFEAESEYNIVIFSSLRVFPT